MTTATELDGLTNSLCEGLAVLPGEQVQNLIQSIRATHHFNLPGLMPEVIRFLRRGVENIRRLAEHNADQLYDASEALEWTFSELRGTREGLEDVHAEMENLLCDASDILQNHLSAAAASPKALQFGQTVLLDFYNFRHAEEIAAKAQHELYQMDVSIVSEIFDEFFEEAEEIIMIANRIVNGTLERPRRLIFRPPVFSPVRFFTVYDTYEQVRGVGQGAAVLKPLQPLQRPVRWAAKRLKIPVSVMTAVFGMQSLGHSRRAGMRREVVSSAAEQMRRTLAAALQQLHFFQRNMNHEIRKGIATYFELQSGGYRKRLRELNSQRRSSQRNALKAERVLLSSERIAQEILARVKSDLSIKETR